MDHSDVAVLIGRFNAQFRGVQVELKTISVRAQLTASEMPKGIPVSEQIRRGIRLWLDQKRAPPTSTKRKASSAWARGKRT